MADPVSWTIFAAKWVGSAVIGTAVGGVTATGIAAGLTKLAVLSTLSVATNKISGKQPKRFSGQQLEVRADPQAGYDTVIGRTAVAGHNVFQYPTASGRPDKFANAVMCMFMHLSGCGPIDAVESFYIQNVSRTWSNSTGEVSGPLNDKMWLKTALGSTSQIALTAPTWPSGWQLSLPEWTSNHRMRGHAHAWLSLYADEDNTWANGIDPLFVLRGVKAYDPRYDSTYPGGSGPQRINDQSTWGYTTNPYIIALTYVIGWRHNDILVGGVGAAISSIDFAAFVSGANVADTNNWKVGGVFNSLDDRWAVLKAILASAGGEPIAAGATISCLVSAPRTSLATVTIDDVCGPISIPAVKSRRDRLNSIIPRYRSEAHNWQVVAADTVTVSAYVTDDGKLRQKEREFVYCQDAKQAGQLAAYEIVNGREFGPVAITLKPKWLGVRPGDAITLNLPDEGLSSQLVIVRQRDINYETGEVTLTVESETTAKHAFALGRDPHPPISASLTRPDFATFPAPVADDWDTAPGGDVAGMPSLIITRLADELPMVAQVIVEYRAAADQPWVTFGAVPATQQRIDVTGIAGLHEYGIAIRYRSIYDGISDRTILVPVTTPALISDGSDGLVDGEGNIIPAPDILEDILAIEAAAEAEAEARRNVARIVGERIRELRNELQYVRDSLVEVDYSQFTARDELKVSLKAELSTAKAAIDLRAETLASDLNSLAQVVLSLTATVNTKASAEALLLLTARVTTAEGEIDAISAFLVELTAIVDDKAEATALAALTVRVTDTENGLVTLASDITDLGIEVDDKASADALDALEIRIGDTEDGIELLGTSLTALEGEVDGKASATALDSLEIRVEDTEDGIVALSSSYTYVEALAEGVSADGLLSFIAEAGPSGPTSSIVLKTKATTLDSALSVGMTILNDGVDGSILFNALKVYFLPPDGSTEGIEITPKYVRAFKSGAQVIIGTDFGVSGQGLMLWAGANVGAVGASKANGVFWADDAGNALFRGTFVSGEVAKGTKKGTFTTTLATDPWLSTGADRVLSHSFEMKAEYTGIDIGNGTFTANLNLERSLDSGSSWTTIDTISMSGSYSSVFSSPPSNYAVKALIRGSKSYTDTSGSAVTVMYRSRVSDISWDWTTELATRLQSQTISWLEE